MNRVLWIVTLAVLAGCSDDSYSVPKLTKMLEDPDASNRCSAVEALARYGPEAKPAVPLLSNALQDGDPSVCVGAAYALAAIGPDAEPALPQLLEALKSKNADLRLAAVYAIPCVAIHSSSS
jgi:HEAT repeat protein